MNTNSNADNAAAAEASTDGRLIGLLSIAAFPGTVLIGPTLFAVSGFFLAMIGLTLAAPKQRIFSIAGLVLAVAGYAISSVFHTVII